MLFGVNDKVFVKEFHTKGIVKEMFDDPFAVGNDRKYKITFFFSKQKDEEKKRMTKWFTEDQLAPWNGDKKKVERKQQTKIKEVNDDTLYFAKVRSTAVIPSRRYEDGCYDVYADQSIERVIIKPHEIVEIATGIASAFSSQYRLDFQRERGSTGSIGLVPRCGQVDSGYRGEIFLKLQNVTNTTIILSKETDKTIVRVVNDKEYIEYPLTKAICQAALEIVPNVEIKEIKYEELEKIPSERGKGKVGSSNK